MTMKTDRASRRYYIPALGTVWSSLDRLAWPLVRIAAGALLIPHGAQKLFGLGATVSGSAQFFSKAGIEPAYPLALYISLLELVGGALLAIGLFTRPVAFLVACFMAVAVFHVHLANGFFWTKLGFEYPLMWLILSLAVLIRGGGELSVDRAMAKEF